MPNPKKKTIRIYFRDHQHTESYLSFASEDEAARYVAKLRDRFRVIKVLDEEDQTEHFDPETALRVIDAAARRIRNPN